MRKLTIIYVLLFSIVGSAFSQKVNSANELKQYEQKFQQGKRDIEFVNSYIQLLTNNKKIEQANRITDIFLMEKPLKKRYNGENLDLFLVNINSIHSNSVKELIINWNKVAEQNIKPRLEKKINKLYLDIIIKFVFKYSHEGIIDKNISLGELQNDFKNINDFKKLYLFIKITEETKTGNTQEIINILSNIYTKQHFSISEKIILNIFLSIILEKSDKKQCNYIIDLIKSESAKGNNLFIKRLDEFNGKLMFFEYDNK